MSNPRPITDSSPMVHRHVRKDFAHFVAPNLYYRVLEMEKVIEGHEAAMRQLQAVNEFRERQQKRCQARLKELLEENTEVGGLKHQLANARQAALTESENAEIMGKIIKVHEAAMRGALTLVKYMANNWPGCACDSEDKCSVHLIEGILRAGLEKS